MARNPIIRENPPKVPPGEACIHCYGSGWILDPIEDDEERTFPCHMCQGDASEGL
jgi:hypothetical protein